MGTLRTLSETYVSKFNAKDLEGVGQMMAENMVLSDPEVKGLTPKSEVLSYIEKLFENNADSLSFTAERIIAEGDTSVIEFTLQLGDVTLKGTDVITWDDGKMVNMDAYLNPVA